jgi:excisionase family DNA binding protein
MFTNVGGILVLKENLMSSEAMAIETANNTGGMALPKLGYSIKEAEKITGLGRTTLWKAINNGRLKCFRAGRRVLFSLDHLTDFLKSYER